MKMISKQSLRRSLGRVSTETKGAPGFAMEPAGLWIGHNDLLK